MDTASDSVLHPDDRLELRSWLRSSAHPSGPITRAKILLDLDGGYSVREVAERQRVGHATVSRWKARYLAEGIDSLADRPRSGRPSVIEPSTVERVLTLTKERVPPESDHWSLALMAKYAGTTIWQVRQIWEAAGLAPHRIRTFKISNDPAFAEKVVDVVGLYMNPPQNAVVFSVDEKTQIQALERTQKPLPMSERKRTASSGHAETRTHDYRRHGVTNLYAAFDLLSGEVIGRLTKRARGREFLAFLRQIDKRVPPELDLHLILDNSSTHGTPEVKAWLTANPRVKLHHTPTSASWLNAVEGWFAQLERRALRRGVFTSVAELKKAIEAFIKAHNKHSAKPFKWTKKAEKIIAAVERAKQVNQN
jgi:transposase